MARSNLSLRQRQVQHRYSSDMLSQIPEEIQRRILSFLPTADAARTGVCSKLLWIAWCSVAQLIFNFYDFPEVDEKADKFLRFMKNTLDSHDDSDVKIFEVLLWLSMKRSIPINNKWIKFAIEHNVEKLVLFGRFARHQKLPNCMFLSHSLVKLELAVDKLFLAWPEHFELPNLRSLKLKFLLLSQPQIRRDLFSHFPALEKLSIMFCQLVNFTDGLHISASNLEEFVICNSPGMEECSISFETPPLSKFVYICPAESEIDLVLPEFEIGIIIKSGIQIMQSLNADELSPSVVKVTKELLKGHILKLGLWLVEHLCMMHDLPKQVASFSNFYNLKELHVDIWPLMEHVIVMLLLISKCPNLNLMSLEFQRPERGPIFLPYFDLDFDNYDFEGGFRSMSHVDLIHFSAEKIEMLFVETLLAHSSNLILMKIVMSMSMLSGQLGKNINKILGYKKASELADVIFD